MPAIDLRGLSGADKALRAYEANTSPRAQKMAELERWVEGSQYDGLPDWFTVEEVPLFERAPCVVYPAARLAIYSHTDLALGEGKWPTFRVGTDADEDAEQQLRELHRRCNFQLVATEVLEAAMGCGSACMLLGLRAGRLVLTTFKAGWCTPVLDDDGFVLSVEVRYPYIEERQRPDGKWEARCMLYRRVVDAQRDVTYLPVEADEDGREPTWKVDPQRDVAHGLGFCPVVWYPHLRGTVADSRFDGTAVHDRLLDEIRAHDFALSQRHRAALYTGDPLIVETGVPRGTNPSRTGPVVEMPATPGGGVAWQPFRTESGERAWRAPDGTVINVAPEKSFSYVSRPADKQGRVKSPGQVWSYEQDNVEVEVHSLPPGALDAIENNARDIRSKLAEAFAVVHLNPDDIKFAATLSGKAMAALMRRQTSRADKLRADFGDRFLVPATKMMVRVVQAAGRGVVTRGGVDRLLALDPEVDLDLQWPSYFPPDHDEEEKLASTVREDFLANIIKLETAVQRRAASYGIVDVVAYCEELEQEKQARDEIAMAIQRADETFGVGGDDGDGDEPPAPAKKKVAPKKRAPKKVPK